MVVEKKKDASGRTYYIDLINGGRIGWHKIDIAIKSKKPVAIKVR